VAERGCCEKAEGRTMPWVVRDAIDDINRVVGRHQFVPADTLNQTWGTADRFSLTLRLRGPDTSAALDERCARRPRWAENRGRPRAIVRGDRGRGMIVDGCTGMLRVRSWLPQKTAD